MNYHNFASRLSISIQRLPAANVAKTVDKPEPKKVRRPARRRFAPAAAAAALALMMGGLTPRAEAADQDGPRAARLSGRVNVPTLLVTLTGLGVAFLRVPALWRRDLDC